MATAVAVAIPAGVNPAAAVPAGADVVQHSSQKPGGLPPVPRAVEQTPGFVPNPAPAQAATTAPAGSDAEEFAAFQAWKASQAAAKAESQPVERPAEPVVPEKPQTPAEQAQAASVAVDAVKSVASQDPYLTSTFATLDLVAPGIDLARAVGTAIDRADLTLVDKAYLREVGGDKADKLIQIAEGVVEHVNTKVEQIVQGVYATCGGEQQFNAAVAVLNEKAPKYLRQFIADGLDSKNPKRIQAAAESLAEFVKSTGAIPVHPEGHVRAGGGTPEASLGLSKAEYQAARQKLDRNDRNYAEHVRELDARRQLGKNNGK